MKLHFRDREMLYRSVKEEYPGPQISREWYNIGGPDPLCNRVVETVGLASDDTYIIAEKITAL